MKTESEFHIEIPTKSKKMTNYAIRKMSRRFGGVSIFKTKGAWINPKTNRVMYDNNLLLTSGRDLDGTPRTILKKDRIFMEDLAREIGRKEHQKAMYIGEDLWKDIEVIDTSRLKTVI